MGTHKPSPDNGAAPVRSIEGDTTQATRMTETLSTMVSHPPAGMSGADVLDQLAERIALRTNGGGGGDGGGRKFFGIDGHKLWGKAIYAVAGAVVFLFSWYVAVNQGLENRPTKEQMKAAVETEVTEKINVHEGRFDPHPNLKDEMVRTRTAVENLNNTLQTIQITNTNVPPVRRPTRRARPQ